MSLLQLGVITSLGPIQGMISISFNLVELAIYFFIGLTPPLISFYLFHQKKINKKIKQSIRKTD